MTTEFNPAEAGPLCWGDCEDFLPVTRPSTAHPFLCDGCHKTHGNISPMMKFAYDRFLAMDDRCPACGSADVQATKIQCVDCRVVAYVQAQISKDDPVAAPSVQAAIAKHRAIAEGTRLTPAQIAERAKAGRMTPEEIRRRAEARELGKLEARRKARLVLVCPVCGKEFNPIGVQKCCSKRCKEAFDRGPCEVCGNYNPSNRVCPTCCNPFEPTFINQIHCSLKCAVVGFPIEAVVGFPIEADGPQDQPEAIDTPDTFRVETLEDMKTSNYRLRVTRMSDGAYKEEDIDSTTPVNIAHCQGIARTLAEELGYREGIDILE